MAHSHQDTSHATGAVTRDPVCGMTVDPDAGKPSLTHEGHVYHFCCDGSVRCV